MKAGLMEIADLFVINKADRPGADRLAREVDMMMHLRLGNALKNIPAHHGVIKRKSGVKMEVDPNAWTIPVLQTVAETAKGVPELAVTLAKHRDWLSSSGELAERRRKRLKERVRETVERQLQSVVWRERGGERMLEDALADMEAGRASPYAIADRITGMLSR
jgi:LAO/AO transport system kinase